MQARNHCPESLKMNLSRILIGFLIIFFVHGALDSDENEEGKKDSDQELMLEAEMLQKVR